MINIANMSFVFIGMITIAFGIIFAVRKRARIFYGVNVEGTKAIVAGGILVLFGIGVLVWALFFMPDMLDGIFDDLPEFQNQ